MLRKLHILFEKHADALRYLFFGVLTTLINYAVYWPLYNLANCSATLSTVISWLVSVVFAFITNKRFVFYSPDWSVNTVFPEFWRFIFYRLGSGLLETALIFVFVEKLYFNGNMVKLITSILVIILNYIASKLLVFTEKNIKDQG